MVDDGVSYAGADCGDDTLWGIVVIHLGMILALNLLFLMGALALLYMLVVQLPVWLFRRLLGNAALDITAGPSGRGHNAR